MGIDVTNSAGRNDSVSLRLVLTGEEHVPIYLQLVHQIRYLVTSRELSAGAQLPSVRALATELGINTGTVAQAYRVLKAEGLIDSQQGRGTFVTPQPDEARSFSARQVRFNQLVEETVAKAFAMGFDHTEIRQQLLSSLQQQVRTVPFVLVAPNESAAHKYAKLVREALPSELLPTITPCTIEEIKRGEPRVLDAYRRAYFTIVAFVSNVPTVDESLRSFGVESEVIGLTAILSPSTIAALRQLNPTEQYALITEARNVNSALGLLAQHAPIDLGSLRILTELSSETQISELSNERIIYTFGVSELLAHHNIPQDKSLELAFTLSKESYERLQHLTWPTDAPA